MSNNLEDRQNEYIPKKLKLALSEVE